MNSVVYPLPETTWGKMNCQERLPGAAGGLHRMSDPLAFDPTGHAYYSTGDSNCPKNPTQIIGGRMLRFLTARWVSRVVLVMTMFMWLGVTRAADLDPKAITI